MTGFLIKLTLAFLFLSCASAACVNAQNVPKTNEQISASALSTDESRHCRTAKNKGRENHGSGKCDEKLKTKRRAASRLDAGNVCVERFKKSSCVIVIGTFRNNYGCRFEGAFVDSSFYERTKIELHKDALAAFGWEKANQKERGNLAKIWVEKGLVVFAPLTNQVFSAVLTGDGSVKVTASSKYPPGITSRNVTKSFVFDKDGKLSPGSNF